MGHGTYAKVTLEDPDIPQEKAENQPLKSTVLVGESEQRPTVPVVYHRPVLKVEPNQPTEIGGDAMIL